MISFGFLLAVSLFLQISGESLPPQRIFAIECLHIRLDIQAHDLEREHAGKCGTSFSRTELNGGHTTRAPSLVGAAVHSESYGSQAGLDAKESLIKLIAKPPPLETIPLIISGPITNRVDLVFFSDGCEYPSCLYMYVLPLYIAKICPVNAKSSLMMPCGSLKTCRKTRHSTPFNLF